MLFQRYVLNWVQVKFNRHHLRLIITHKKIISLKINTNKGKMEDTVRHLHF